MKILTVFSILSIITSINTEKLFHNYTHKKVYLNISDCHRIKTDTIKIFKIHEKYCVLADKDYNALLQDSIFNPYLYLNDLPSPKLTLIGKIKEYKRFNSYLLEVYTSRDFIELFLINVSKNNNILISAISVALEFYDGFGAHILSHSVLNNRRIEVYQKTGGYNSFGGRLDDSITTFKFYLDKEGYIVIL